MSELMNLIRGDDFEGTIDWLENNHIPNDTGFIRQIMRLMGAVDGAGEIMALIVNQASLPQLEEIWLNLPYYWQVYQYVLGRLDELHIDPNEFVERMMPQVPIPRARRTSYFNDDPEDLHMFITEGNLTPQTMNVIKRWLRHAGATVDLREIRRLERL